jgi:sterol 3beta-glucosyltransferase
VNRWRKKHLNLPRTDIDTLAQTKVCFDLRAECIDDVLISIQIPFMYNFSPAVVPKPLDWGDIITVSGYWFLDNPDLNWKAPKDLLDFIAKAKADRVPLVYVGSVKNFNASKYRVHSIPTTIDSGVSLSRALVL